MSELRMQKLVCDAVNGEGGKAFKLANRFLVGVSDLFVQVKGFPTLVVEVKLAKYKKLPLTVQLEVTGPQARFLREAWNAGCRSAALLFVRVGNRTYAAIESGDQYSPQSPSVLVSSLVELPHGKRGEAVLRLLKSHLVPESNPEQKGTE